MDSVLDRARKFLSEASVASPLRRVVVGVKRAKRLKQAADTGIQRAYQTEGLEKLPLPTQRYEKMKRWAQMSYAGSDLSKRDKDRRIYGMLRKRGWKPHRER